ncbi:MAG: hypothetical protein KC493_14910 [Bacteriovoracaceae bacterium]|nr:hypothetical protein [Bacteriovoracaceae bacterium]
MSQVILIEPNSNLNELLTLNLQTYTGSEVIPRESASEALELMKILPGIDLVISRNKIGEEDSAQLLYEYISSNDTEIGLIILGSVEQSMDDVAIVQDNINDFEETIRSASKILGVNEDVLSKKVLPDYIPIPLNYFFPLDTTACDVFIRIKKGPDEYQFVKRIHAGDTYSKTMVQKYIDQGLNNFYIPKDMQKNFTNSASDQLVAKLEQDYEDIDEHITLMSQSMDMALNDIKNMGFTSATIQLTESIIDNIIETTEKSPEMSGFLRKIVNSKTSYMYQHCHMTSIVANECLKKLKLNKDNNFQRLAYASFFKDISLVDNEELAKISTFDELENKELSDEDWDLVFNHALEASIMVRKQSEVPLGVDDIIKVHHGSQNGKGFSTVNVSKFTPLQQIFVISCEFVREILKFKEVGGKPTPIVDELYKKYPHPETTVVIRTLEKVLRKSKSVK